MHGEHGCAEVVHGEQGCGKLVNGEQSCDDQLHSEQGYLLRTMGNICGRSITGL